MLQEQINTHLNNHHPKKHAISFKHAFAGVIQGFQGEPRFQIQLMVALLAIVAGSFYKISQTEWLILILTMAFVLTTELLNTAVENVVDLVTLDEHRLAKVAKDCAAGAVLVSAAASIIIGLLIFLPYLV